MAESVRLVEARARYEATRNARDGAKAYLASMEYERHREKALDKAIELLTAYRIDDLRGEGAMYVVGRLRQIVDELVAPKEVMRQAEELWAEIQMLERIEGSKK